MTVDEERRRLGGAFAQGGGEYERLRPTYPPEAVAWMVADAPPGVIADIGAGTGKLTSVLLECRDEVVAVEPSTDMADRLRASLPSVEVTHGRGESTGLADGSVSACVYGQAWHWVEPAAGTAEMARVLRPGGVLGLIWNFMDTHHPAADALNRAMHVLDPGRCEHAGSADAVGEPFAHRERRLFTWEWQTTTAALADLVTTRSYYLTRAEPERAEIRQAVVQVVEEHFGPIGDNPASLQQITEVYRFVR